MTIKRSKKSSCLTATCPFCMCVCVYVHVFVYRMKIYKWLAVSLNNDTSKQKLVVRLDLDQIS